MRKDVLALGEGLPECRGEVRNPLRGGAIATVHRSKILVVDVDTIQAVRLDPLRHRVSGVDGVGPRGRGGVGRAERGRDDLDASLVVLVLLCGLVPRGEGGEPACLVQGTLEGEEGERDDVVALKKRMRQW